MLLDNMVNSDETKLYREKVCKLLSSLRSALYVESGRLVFPTDASIAFMLSISPTALSSISRRCSSMSALTLCRLFRELSSRLETEDFNKLLHDFIAS